MTQDDDSMRSLNEMLRSKWDAEGRIDTHNLEKVLVHQNRIPTLRSSAISADIGDSRLKTSQSCERFRARFPVEIILRARRSFRKSAAWPSFEDVHEPFRLWKWQRLEQNTVGHRENCR